MKKNQLNKNANELKKLKNAAKEIDLQIKKLQNDFKEYFQKNNLSEYKNDLVKIELKEVNQNSFNSDNFKKDYPDLFDEYSEKKVIQRFYVK